MADYFNALDYAHQLEAAGVPTGQAEVHAQALAQVLEKCLSVAADTDRLRSEVLFKIAEVEVTLRSEIRAVETRLTAKIDTEAADIRRRIDTLEARMNERFRWQWWANGVMMAMLIGLYFR